MHTCLKIVESARPLLFRRALAVNIAVFLCQAMVAAAQPCGTPTAPRAELGTGSAPAPVDMTIPEPAMKAPAAATGSPEPPLNNAHANLAPDDPPGQWTRQARDYANTRYSPLTQINKTNVGKLRIAWTFSDGQMYGHEGAPLVVGDTMYLVTPYPNIAYALDLSKAGAPIKWVFQPNPDPRAIGEACCDKVLRGWAYADGKLIYNLLDDHTVAVDANDRQGSVARAAGRRDQGPDHDPGGLRGRRQGLCRLQRRRAGHQWLVPGAGCEGRPHDLEGVHQWPRLRRADRAGLQALLSLDEGQGSGRIHLAGRNVETGRQSAPWGWVSYDPDLNEIYYGTSNPGPRTPSQRPGLNLWSSAVFARDANTGAAKWAYQFTPHDEWDYDGVNENVLIEIPWKGARRKVMVHFNRNGFAYTIDRATGEVLVAEPFGLQNWAKKIDLATGMPVVNDAAHPIVEKKVENICPPDIGVKNWNPSAFSPRTGLLYAGVFNSCMDLTNHIVQYIPGAPYDGMEMVRHAGPGGNWGEFIAWDPVAGKRVWSIKENLYVWSGAVVTGSDLVFYGTMDGWFRAVDARSGKVLWSQKLGSGITGRR